MAQKNACPISKCTVTCCYAARGTRHMHREGLAPHAPITTVLELPTGCACWHHNKTTKDLLASGLNELLPRVHVFVWNGRCS